MAEQKKSELTKLYKPCGKEMHVNEKSLEYALSLGWTSEAPEKEESKEETKEESKQPAKTAAKK